MYGQMLQLNSNGYIIKLGMSKEGTVYMGLVLKYTPPMIGVLYRDRLTDEKKKVYTILLNNLVFNPNADEVVEQLYREHPHILKQNKVPKDKIKEFFLQIQAELQHHDDYEEEEPEEPVREKGNKRPAANYEDDEDDDDRGVKGFLNKSR